MDQKIVYSKTGKGVLEIKNKAGKLSRELAKVLSQVDGKSAVADLIAKSKLAEANLARCLKQLEDGGYIKEFASLSGVMSSASTSSASSYVDDLDFTTTLSPGKRVYSNAQSDFSQSESASRKRAEAEATKNRQAGEERKRQDAKNQAREESVRMARIEAERKAKEAAAIKARQQAELNEKRQAAEMAKTTRDLAKILEAERQALDKSDGKKNEEKARRSKEDAERKRAEDEDRRKREKDDQRKREDEDRRKREDEDRRKQEEEENQRREEDERKRREEEDRKREEEERRKREEEERRKREEEERRQEEEDRKRREDEDRRREEEDRRREEEDRKRREEEDRKREEEDRERREEDDRRREEEDRKRREEDDRRREEEGRQREEEANVPTFDIDSFEDINIPSVPDASESASESFDLPHSTTDSGSSFAVDFEKQQEMLKKQAEDEERQIQEAEEARLAMERAAREEDARAEAERRSAVEAEMRARVEQEKEERSDRERSKKEEYTRKVQEDEDRKKFESEEKIRAEQQRIDSERKQREEELVRRRQGTEESDRKRRELKALKKAGKVHSPAERLKPIVGGVVVVIALAVGALHVIPMSAYIPTVEKIASDNIGEPVTIGSMKVSMLSGLQFKLANVNVGVTQDVTLNDVTVSPELGSIFGQRLIVKSIRADGGKIVKEALLRLPSWRNSSASDPRMLVRSIALRGMTMEMRTFKLPSLNADVALGRDGQVLSARVETANGKVFADIEPGDGRARVSIGASNWTPPFGTPIELTDFAAKGSVVGSVLNLSEWDATVYGGQVKGSAQISWESGWRASSQFEFVRMATEELLAAFTKTAKASGSASGNASFTARAGSLDTLLERPTLQASFLVQKGTLDGVDLVRALQVGSAGSQGGSTKFEELRGDVTIANGQYKYRNVVLSAGILSANGNFNIASDQAVSGRVSVALRSSAQRLSANLNATGSLKGVLLRP
jgi:hypothetical protein